MSSEEKIQELTARIEKLEKAEKRRNIKKGIGIAIRVIELAIIAFLFIKAYYYIKPYKEKIDSANEKIENVETLLNDKFGSITNYFKK